MSSPGTIPVPGASRRQQRDHVILDFWPADWSERYFSQGYVFHDPTVRRVATSTDPFSWGEVEPLCRDDPAAKRIMAEAGEHLNSGFTVPLLTVEGTSAGFSLAGRRLEITGRTGHADSPRHLCARARHPDQGSGRRGGGAALPAGAGRPAMGGRRQDRLGDRPADGHFQHGVDRHMRVARQKLGAASRTHAVAEAIRRGIIT